VREAVDGLDAIKEAKKSKPDLILLDLAMPQWNGAEVAAVLKNTMPEVAVVLFTLNTDLYADTACAALGVAFILEGGWPSAADRTRCCVAAANCSDRGETLW